MKEAKVYVIASFKCPYCNSENSIDADLFEPTKVKAKESVASYEFTECDKCDSSVKVKRG